MASYSTRVDMREVERMLEKLGKQLKNAPAGVKAGYFEGKAYPNGLTLEKNALIQEYGETIKIPEHEQKIYKSYNEKRQNFNKNGRFEKKSQANFAQSVTIPEHTITIPPRPFLRNAMETNEEHFHKVFKQSIQRGKTVRQALRLVGQQMRNAIIESINTTLTPPNAKSTIKSKGSSHPLIDSGTLRNSVGYEVIEE